MTLVPFFVAIAISIVAYISYASTYILGFIWQCVSEGARYVVNSIAACYLTNACCNQPETWSLDFRVYLGDTSHYNTV